MIKKGLMALCASIIAGLFILPLFSSCGKQISQMDRLGSVLPEAPEGYVWELITELSDEFNSDYVDESKWIKTHPWSRGRPPSYFDSTNLFVRNGNLELLSTADRGDSEKVKDPHADEWVRAACLSSREQNASYGYYEVNMKASDLDMVSAFWFHGKYSEIDVVEEFGRPVNDPDKRFMMLSCTHYKYGTPEYASTPARWKMPTCASDEYHIYGVWWKDKNTIMFYHNNEKVNEVKTKDFLEPLHLILDTEVMKSGLPTVESLLDPDRNTFYVDWVRGWRLAKAE